VTVASLEELARPERLALEAALTAWLTACNGGQPTISGVTYLGYQAGDFEIQVTIKGQRIARRMAPFPDHGKPRKPVRS
jgi:hypothetical protein